MENRSQIVTIPYSRTLVSTCIVDVSYKGWEAADLVEALTLLLVEIVHCTV